jgi:hypothetical protein
LKSPHLQAQNLAHAKAQALCDQHHRPVWFAQMLEQLKKLAHFKDPWPLEPLASIFHAHQRNRVLAEFDNAPPLRTLEDQVHDSPYMSL